MNINFSQLSQVTPDQIVDLLKGVDKKTWIQVAAAAAILIILGVFLIYPAWFKRFELRMETAKIKKQIAQTNALFAKRPELVKTKEDSHAFTQNAKSKMYTPSEASLLLGVISRMANDSKVTIISSKPRPMESEFPEPFSKMYEAVLYDVTVEGGYHAVGDFAARLESNPKLLRIQNFVIRPQENSQTLHFADFTLSAVSVTKNAPSMASLLPPPPKERQRKKK